MGRYEFMRSLHGPGLFDNQAGIFVMCDDPATRRGYEPLVLACAALAPLGAVVVFGLGLGVCVRMIQDLPGVHFLLVVEKDQALIDFVLPSAGFNRKVQVVCADAWEFRSSVDFDVVWGDIFSGNDLFDGALAGRFRDRIRLFAAPCGFVGMWRPQ